MQPAAHKAEHTVGAETHGQALNQSTGLLELQALDGVDLVHKVLVLAQGGDFRLVGHHRCRLTPEEGRSTGKSEISDSKLRSNAQRRKGSWRTWKMLAPGSEETCTLVTVCAEQERNEMREGEIHGRFVKCHDYWNEGNGDSKGKKIRLKRGQEKGVTMRW